jgi:predicted dehydrogenase
LWLIDFILEILRRKGKSIIEKLEIGIVGCGWIVEFVYLPELEKKEEVWIKAVFDTNMERAQDISKKFSIECVFDKFEDFLNCGLDGIIIATPNVTHIPYTLEALRRNIGVLCEKPVALKSVEVDEIIKICTKQNVVYVPGFVNRWRVDIQELYSAFKEEKLGKIESVEAGWLRKSGVPRPGTWFTNRKFSGGGVLVDLGSHIMDICLMLLGDRKPQNYELITSICNQEKIKQKDAAEWFKSSDNSKYEMDVEDTVIADVQYEDGVTLSIKLSWLAPIEADCTYFRVIGTEGWMELKTLFGFSSARLWKEDILQINIAGKEEVIQFDMSENKSVEAFGEMLSYYCNSLRCRNTVSVNCYDALKTVSFIEKLYQEEVRDESRVVQALSEVYIETVLYRT